MLPATAALIRIAHDEPSAARTATLAAPSYRRLADHGGLLLSRFAPSPSCWSPWPRRPLSCRAARAIATAPGT